MTSIQRESHLLVPVRETRHLSSRNPFIGKTRLKYAKASRKYCWIQRYSTLNLRPQEGVVLVIAAESPSFQAIPLSTQRLPLYSRSAQALRFCNPNKLRTRLLLTEAKHRRTSLSPQSIAPRTVFPTTSTTHSSFVFDPISLRAGHQPRPDV